MNVRSKRAVFLCALSATIFIGCDSGDGSDQQPATLEPDTFVAELTQVGGDLSLSVRGSVESASFPDAWIISMQGIDLGKSAALAEIEIRTSDGGKPGVGTHPITPEFPTGDFYASATFGGTPLEGGSGVLEIDSASEEGMVGTFAFDAFLGVHVYRVEGSFWSATEEVFE